MLISRKGNKPRSITRKPSLVERLLASFNNFQRLPMSSPHPLHAHPLYCLYSSLGLYKSSGRAVKNAKLMFRFRFRVRLQVQLSLSPPIPIPGSIIPPRLLLGDQLVQIPIELITIPLVLLILLRELKEPF
jgi:hypothetical protein